MLLKNKLATVKDNPKNIPTNKYTSNKNKKH